MPKKPKFNPEVSRVNLNPEQAVLACDCYSGMKATTLGGSTEYCVPGNKSTMPSDSAAGEGFGS